MFRLKQVIYLQYNSNNVNNLKIQESFKSQTTTITEKERNKQVSLHL